MNYDLRSIQPLQRYYRTVVGDLVDDLAEALARISELEATVAELEDTIRRTGT